MEKLTTTELRKLNKENVYRLLYNTPEGLTQQKISYTLELSRPTVTQNLNDLLLERKIIQGKLQVGTGGRPATTYHFKPNAKVSIGVEVLVEKLKVAVVDLYGNIEKESSIPLAFINAESYFQSACSWISNFIEDTNIKKDCILGVTISFQGIMAEDNEHIIFGKLLNSNGFTRSDFARHLEYPISLVHDAEMAASAELWHYSQLENAVYLSLNPYMGSAMIVNGTVVHTPNLSAGTVEHIIMYPKGQLCYCGKRGCAEAYCSVNSLERRMGLRLSEIFSALDNNDIATNIKWTDYLKDLAMLIDNCRMVIGGDVILGGLLSRYIRGKDIDTLYNYIEDITVFKNIPFKIYRGHYHNQAALVGSALQNITTYLQNEKLK